jgi:hypothetical protein
MIDSPLADLPADTPVASLGFADDHGKLSTAVQQVYGLQADITDVVPIVSFNRRN